MSNSHRAAERLRARLSFGLQNLLGGGRSALPIAAEGASRFAHSHDPGGRNKISRPEPAPPLKSWLAAFVIILLVASLTASVVNRAIIEEQAPLVSYERTRLQSFRNNAVPGKNARRVIAVGTSLLACATFFDGDMESFAADHGLRMSFLRIARGAMSFEELSDQLDYILAARPEILIIERDILHSNNRWYRHAESARALLRKLFSSLAGVDTKKNAGPVNLLDDDLEIDKLPMRKGAAEFAQYAAARRNLRDPDWRSNKKLTKEFMDKARKQGISIVLLGMPRSLQAEALASDSAKARILSYFAFYREQYQALVLDYPGKLGPEYFRDYSHLTRRGRQLFSGWLVSELQKIKLPGGGN